MGATEGRFRKLAEKTIKSSPSEDYVCFFIQENRTLQCYFVRDLPRQQPQEAAVVPDEYEFIVNEEEVPELRGTLHSDNSSVNNGESNLLVGMDVCVYTEV